MVPDCSKAWETLACDISEFKEKFFLTAQRRFSLIYTVVRKALDHSVAEKISKFSSIFAELGVLLTIHCYRGSNFTSTKFQDFCKSLNIKLTFSSAEHHSSNYAEKSVQTVKKFMRRTDEWQLALLEYLIKDSNVPIIYH